MSFNTFKANMGNYMTNQGGIGNFNDFAKKLTNEYNMCILRGFQDTNMIPLSTGNTAGMEGLVIIACATALSKTGGLHTFADDIGKGVVAYWTGAQLTVGIPPIIPATNAVQNITTTAAICMNPGVWTPIGPLANNNETDTFLSILAAGMVNHLTTTVFMYSTISIYPGAPPPVAPGVLVHPAYLVPG